MLKAYQVGREQCHKLGIRTMQNKHHVKAPIIRMNASMKALLASNSIDVGNPPVKLSKRLEEVVAKGVVCVNGGYFLAQCVPPDEYDWDKDDLTGHECSQNHLHMDRYIDQTVPVSEVSRISVAYCFRLQQLLAEQFPHVPFRISGSTEVDNLRYWVVRFHKIRPNETWLDIDDLEGYSINQVLAIDVNTSTTK